MKNKISAKEFDKIFDDGAEDVMQYVDLSSATRLNRSTRKVNVDMPEWMIKALDDAADHLSINRQAIIKIWLSDRIEKEALLH